MTTQERVPQPGRKRGALRTLLSVVAAGGCILLAPIALLVHWTSETMLDTDSYVAAVQGVPQQPEVAQALAEVVVDEVSGQIALPQFLISAARSQLILTVKNAVESDPFHTVWTNANRTGHAVMISVLGSGNELTDTQGEAVVLDVGALFAAAAEQLPGGLMEQALNIAAKAATLEPLTVQIPVSPNTFATVKLGVQTIRIANIAVPVAGLGLGLSALLLTPRRRRTLLTLTAGTTLICAAFGLAVMALRGMMPAGTNPAMTALTSAFTDALTTPLLQSAFLASGISAVIFGFGLFSHRLKTRKPGAASGTLSKPIYDDYSPARPY